MLEVGRVTVNGRVARKALQPLEPGAAVSVSDRPATQGLPAHGPPKGSPSRDPRLRIIYEDDDLLVVDKPNGLLTSTVPREKRPTLLAIVQRHVEGPPHAVKDRTRSNRPRSGRRPDAHVGLIHRLDRDAAGLLVFSKNHDAYRSLKQQFFDHTVERLYTAVVAGVPTPRAGRIESRLVERADGTVHSTDRHGAGEFAATEYGTIEQGKRHSVVRVKLHTGRKHQIRVHLSERGVPILGDNVYGRDNAREGAPLHLAATKLSFTHPRTGERKTFELPRPEWSIVNAK
jgi:23S rRNA pseudouridine1911/1915/1917 synthase